MLSQWDCFLKNLGEWHGSFTRFSPAGVETEDTPSIVTIEGRDDNRAVHQVVRYLPHDEPPRDVVVDYSHNSLNRSILFFENGAFCQGSMQLAPYSQFGAEFGLIMGDRRLRTVILYNGLGQLERVVVIREKLPESKTPEQPALTVDSLIGNWQGEAITMYPDYRNPDIYNTELQITAKDSNHIEQKLAFGDRAITSQARIDGSRLLFENSNLPVQILLLPDGTSCNCPIEAKLGHKFVLETGWLWQPNKRQRLIRTYNEKGNWVNCTLVTEEKIE
ncbi:DUF3598 family protein [Myxosarcina sp. GI1]|uniref:DUF3598 family protein n=1 Tax=Myxosarcina sp. GI1 TaxID=1541065 RepID=UPI000566F9E8